MPTMFTQKLTASTLTRLSSALLLTASAIFAATIASAATTKVVVVGNAAGGTVSFLDGASFNNLGTINVVPDLVQRKIVLYANPVTLAGYQSLKNQKGGDRYVDDSRTSPDGKTLYVSRGMLEDVAAFDIATKKMLWRTDTFTFNSDHMAINADGSKLYVSATTAGVVWQIDTKTGQITGSFKGGTFPHDIHISADGKRIYNDSIGNTVLPQALESLKGDRQITVVDAATLQQIRVYKFEHGVRPSVLTDDEKFYYMQQSYNRGFVEVDLATGNITRSAILPGTIVGDALTSDKYPSNSMHHGLAISGDGTKFCNAGTIDNYVAIVNRADFSITGMVTNQDLPYWATTSHDGQSCLVSNSHGNFISVISYATGAETKRIAVGLYPQRERLGVLDNSVISTLTAQ